MKEPVIGVTELNMNMATFARDAVRLLNKAAFSGAVLIQNEAKSGHGPDAHARGRYEDKTSNLTNSIQAERPKTFGAKIISVIVAGLEYAAPVELGGTYKPPNGKAWRSAAYPFMFPAMESQKRSVLDLVVRLIQSIKWVN